MKGALAMRDSVGLCDKNGWRHFGRGRLGQNASVHVIVEKGNSFEGGIQYPGCPRRVKRPIFKANQLWAERVVEAIDMGNRNAS